MLAFDPAWCVVADAADEHRSAHLAPEVLRDASPQGDLGPERLRVYESLFCLADGVLGTRGVLEEAPGELGPTAVVASGFYEPAAGIGDQLVGLPTWCDLPLIAGLGSGRRVLDLRDGVLRRIVITSAHELSDAGPGDLAGAGSDVGGRGAGDETVSTGLRHLADESGAIVLHCVRFASLARPATGVLVAEIHPNALATPVLARGEPVVEHRRTATGGAVMARSTVSVPAHDSASRRVLVSRISCYVVSNETVPAAATALEGLGAASDLGAAALLAEQRALWAARWAIADIEVVGDVAITRALRLAVFHVLCSAGHGPESAVGARGLSGPAYGGHVLWDTEIFALPVLAAVDPPAARSVLGYRIHRCAPAQRRAAGEGRRGARFPWESAHTGDDVTPRSGIDQSGQSVAIRTGQLEMHITADIAWAAWHYAAWRGDWEFLDGPGRCLVLEPARYWTGRVRWDRDRRAHIDRVIGPDEYHEDVDDNAFTNLMVRWNLRRAAELVERRSSRLPNLLTASSAGGKPHGVDPDRDGDEEAEEAGHWRTIAEALVDGYDPATGRYEQFAGYDQLEPLLVSAIGTPPLAADLVLGHERLTGSQIVKQADVLMGHLLIPEDMAAGSLEANLDFYLPRTAHGSSLSPAVHATLLARAGRGDEALELLSLAAAIDLDDLTQTTAGGLHLANLGGMWQVAVRGFAGVQVERPDDVALVIAPQLPTAWPELRVAFIWHGHQVHLACRHDRVHVGCDTTIDVVVHGSPARVEPPGRWIG